MLTKSMIDMNVKQGCVSPADDLFQSETDRWTDGQTDRLTHFHPKEYILLDLHPTI